MLDTAYEEFTGAKFASIVFCGGNVRGNCGGGGVGAGVSDKLFCVAGVDRVCGGADGAGIFSAEANFYSDSFNRGHGASVF